MPSRGIALNAIGESSSGILWRKDLLLRVPLKEDDSVQCHILEVVERICDRVLIATVRRQGRN